MYQGIMVMHRQLPPPIPSRFPVSEMLNAAARFTYEHSNDTYTRTVHYDMCRCSEADTQPDIALYRTCTVPWYLLVTVSKLPAVAEGEG